MLWNFFLRNLRAFVICWSVCPWHGLTNTLIRKFVNYSRKKFCNTGPWCQCYRTFYNLNLWIFLISSGFVPGKRFQHSLMLVGKARSLSYSGAPEKCFTQVSSGLTCKYYTWSERLASEKHSGLLQKFVNYGRKKFYNIGRTMYSSFNWSRRKVKSCLEVLWLFPQ